MGGQYFEPAAARPERGASQAAARICNVGPAQTMPSRIGVALIAAGLALLPSSVFARSDIRLAMIADDNFNFFQRGEFVEYRLQE